MGLLTMAISSVWNKYVVNCSGRWNGLYSEGYAQKMEDTAQRGRNYLIAGLILDSLQRDPQTPLRVLDVGCGCGTLLPFIRNPNLQYVGVDSSALAVDQCRSRFTRDPMINARFAVDSFETFDSREKFDIIVFNEVLYYFKLRDLDNVFRKISSLSYETNSLLVVSMSRNPKAFLVWQHLNRFATPLNHLTVKASFWSSRWNVKSFRLEPTLEFSRSPSALLTPAGRKASYALLEGQLFRSNRP